MVKKFVRKKLPKSAEKPIFVIFGDFKNLKLSKNEHFWPILVDFLKNIFLPSERSGNNTHFKKNISKKS